MAIKMIFEDDTIKLFFERVNFTFAIPGAALCGILMAFTVCFPVAILAGATAKDSGKKSYISILFAGRRPLHRFHPMRETSIGWKLGGAWSNG